MHKYMSHPPPNRVNNQKNRPAGRTGREDGGKRVDSRPSVYLMDCTGNFTSRRWTWYSPLP